MSDDGRSSVVSGRPRVLVFGASGLLGSHLVARLPRSFVTFATASRGRSPLTACGVRWLNVTVDVGDADSVARAIDASEPDIIVNAIGLTPHAPLAADRAAMDEVNARFPHRLARLADAAAARVVHVSTDGVFSGTRGGYSETDRPDPCDEYGRSKLAGEIGSPHVTVRTSFFGPSPNGRGLIEWLIARPHQTVEGYVDYRFSGMAAWTVADFVAAVIARPDLTGLHHLGGDPITKCELLQAAAAAWQVPITIVPTRRTPVDRTLDSRRFFDQIGRTPPSLVEMLSSVSS